MTQHNEQIGNIQPAAHVSLPFADFDTYRRTCDEQSDDFRIIGIQDEAAYGEAMNDERTIMTDVGESLFPLCVPIEYETMYQPDRTRQLTGADEVYLLATPMQQLIAADPTPVSLHTRKPIAEDIAIVVEEFGDADGSDVESRRADRQQLAKVLQPLGTLAVGEFIHEDLREIPGHESAWMGIYSFALEPSDDGGKPVESADGRVHDKLLSAWEAYRDANELPEYPGELFDGVYLFDNTQVAGDEKLQEQLWSVSQRGFGEVLGAYHPVSMEVTREFFDQQLEADGVMTIVRYHDGEPMCFGTIATDLEHNDWLNTSSPALRQEVAKAAEDDEEILHFFEIISKGEKGMGYAPDVLKLVLDLGAAAGARYRVLFESTNLSALYIPSIVEKQVAANEGLEFSAPVTQFGKLHYWFLKSQTDSAV